MNPDDESADELLRQHVLKLLDRYGGNISLVAQVLGWSRPTVYAHLDRWGIKRGWRDESNGNSGPDPAPKK